MSTLTAIGLAAPAGLNAPLALFLAGFLARVSNDLAFTGRFEFLEETWFLVLVAVWLLAELMLDKLPSLDTVNDLVNTPLRPAAAALLFAGLETPLEDLHPLAAAAVGAVLGAVVHWLKSSYRRRIAGRLGGVADLGASLAEDLLVGLTIVLAVFAPPAALIVLLLAVAPVIRWGVASQPNSPLPRGEGEGTLQQRDS